MRRTQGGDSVPVQTALPFGAHDGHIDRQGQAERNTETRWAVVLTPTPYSTNSNMLTPELPNPRNAHTQTHTRTIPLDASRAADSAKFAARFGPPARSSASAGSEDHDRETDSEGGHNDGLCAGVGGRQGQGKSQGKSQGQGQGDSEIMSLRERRNR